MILFYDDRYLEHQFSGRSIEYCYKYSKKSFIRIWFSRISDGGFLSLPHSTFGGFVGNSVPSIDIYDNLIAKFCDDIKQKGGKFIEIKLPPLSAAYYHVDLQVYALLKNGFSIVCSDLSYIMNINSTSFENIIDYSNLKRLKNLRNNNIVGEILSDEHLYDVYEVIKENRASKNYSLSLSFAEVKKQVEILQSHVFFACKLNNLIIASAICVRINNDTLYVMYWGDLPEYKSYSAVVLLCETIHKYCVQNQIKFIDIGTSTFNLDPNIGLMKFKTDLGFSSCLKLTLSKGII